MLWFKKQPDRAASPAHGGAEVVRPVPLAVEMDERIFMQKFAVLLELVGEVGGADPFIESLGTKNRLFKSLLDPDQIDGLSLEKVELLLETVMPARKRLWPVLEALGEAQVKVAVRDVLYGPEALEERLGVFIGLVPDDAAPDEKTQRKIRRAAHDFAAELLHFRAPEQYPLMTRWVWDPGTLSGAMRELLKGGDGLSDIPLGADAGVYEAGRLWVAEQMAAKGVYREPHFLVDLFFAHAYADYMRAMSSGMGMLNADFGGKSDPLEIVKKLLGIDEARRKESRVKKAGLQ